MDFSLTAEQTLLQDSVSRFIQNDYDFAARQKLVHGGDGFSRAHWQTFAELGWLGVTFPESDGGFGGGAIDLMIMLEQFGKGLVVEPFVPTVVMAGGAIKIAGNAAQKGRYLAGVIDGSMQGALAYVEPQARFNLADITTTARAEGDGFVVNGHKAVVLNGPAADFLVVPVRTAGAQRDRDGVTLLIIDTALAGIWLPPISSGKLLVSTGADMGSAPQSSRGSPMSSVTSPLPASLHTSRPPLVASLTRAKPRSSIRKRATQRVALPQLSDSAPSAL